jgi:hypothetical protein
MVERATKRGKPPASRRRSAGGNGSSEADDRSSGRTRQLERECDRLKEQLAEAQERIVRLEQSRTEAVNRIDWVIDSLHNVLEKGA